MSGQTTSGGVGSISFTQDGEPSVGVAKIFHNSSYNYSYLQKHEGTESHIISGPGTLALNNDSGANYSVLHYKIYPTIGFPKVFKNESENNGDSYDNSVFSIVSGAFTWEEARIDSESRGGRLAVLNTQEKIDTFNSWFVDEGSYYIGATDFDSEGNWVWVNGASVIEDNWLFNEPNNYNNAEHYIAVDGSKFWNDVPLDSNFGYILEAPSN